MLRNGRRKKKTPIFLFDIEGGGYLLSKPSIYLEANSKNLQIKLNMMI